MGTLIILGALLLASTPTIASVILCRKVDGTMWKWVLFGLLDSMFLMTVIVDPSVEPVLYLIGGISAELMGYYMNEKGRNGTVWFFLIASIFVAIFMVITEPEYIYSSGFFRNLGIDTMLLNWIFLETWISAVICAFFAPEKGKSPVIWFMISIATLGIPGLIVLLSGKKA